MSRLLFILLLFLSESCGILLRSQQDSFDKKKWLTSSEYRYEVSKSDKFPNLKGKSQKDVRNLLGEPDEANGEVYIYCLDLNPLKHYDEKSKRNICNCKASYVTIDFKIDERWRTTFSWVETKE